MLVCFAQVPFTKSALADFAAKSLARPLTVVSDGLACFAALQDAGVHEVTVTGGGAGSVRLPQFKAVNTILGVSVRRSHLEFGVGVDNDHVHVGIGGHDDKREDGEAAEIQA